MGPAHASDMCRSDCVRHPCNSPWCRFQNGCCPFLDIGHCSEESPLYSNVDSVDLVREHPVLVQELAGAAVVHGLVALRAPKRRRRRRELVLVGHLHRAAHTCRHQAAHACMAHALYKLLLLLPASGVRVMPARDIGLPWWQRGCALGRPGCRCRSGAACGAPACTRHQGE